jgi:hypothetical protein
MDNHRCSKRRARFIGVCIKWTAGIGALTKKLQSEWLDWFDHRTGPAPKEKLAPFKELLDRGQDPKRLSDPPLVLKEEQVRDLCILHDQLRNNFAHFASKGWSIELAGLPRIIGTAIDVTESLMLNQMQIRIHLEESQITHLQEVIEKIRREILNCRID